MLRSCSTGMSPGFSCSRLCSASSSRISSTTNDMSLRRNRAPFIIKRPPMTLAGTPSRTIAQRSPNASSRRPPSTAPPKPPMPRIIAIAIAVPDARR